jgi:hypothetical protein
MTAQRFLVRVSESAFMHMTLATIAAYDVPRQSPGRGNSARWNETYGLLWGHRINLRNGNCIYSVEHATIDGHAKSAHSWVLPSAEYRGKLSEVIPAFWPSARLIGEFHSHPYKPKDSFPAAPGLSEVDLKGIEKDESDDLSQAGVRVFLVMSIKGLKRKAWAVGGHKPANLLLWSMGRYRFALTAYVATEKPRRRRRPELFVMPRHKGWPKYGHARSPYRGIVTLSAPTGAGLENFGDFGD